MPLFKKVSKAVNTMLKRKLSKNSAAIFGEGEVASKTPRADNSQTLSNSNTETSFAQKFLNIQLDLNAALKPLQFKTPVVYIYNPVEYAFKPNESYVRKYCQGPKKLLFVGMNPGPFGMCQTGVPFGEVKSVRDWLEIKEDVQKPEKECPQRPVLGFECTKSEVSGDRLWSFIKKTCQTPDIFFKNSFVYNYCPLALLKGDGGNVTPSEIKDAKLLEEVCDRFFFQAIQLLKPEIIIGIGRYAEKRALMTLKNNNCDNIKVLFLSHPSPRAVNNHNWPEKAEKFFKNEDLLKYMN